MNQQAAAIIIAGALITGAIALTNHWEVIAITPPLSGQTTPILKFASNLTVPVRG
jgi:hypothetical protein